MNGYYLFFPILGCAAVGLMSARPCTGS